VLRLSRMIITLKSQSFANFMMWILFLRLTNVTHFKLNDHRLHLPAKVGKHKLGKIMS